MDYHAHPFLDRFEPVSRLRAWMRETHKNADDVRATGVSLAEFNRLTDEGTDGTDANFCIFMRLTTGLGAPTNYLFLGEIPNDASKKAKKRLKLWELIEGFSSSMELRGQAAKEFALYTMRRLEIRLDEVDFAVYDRGLPETEDDITPFYRSWLREKQGREKLR